jgi:beta-glucosidase
MPSSQLAAFRSRAQALVAQMTLEEKARACSAHGFWQTQPLERLGIPSIRLAHGSHGVLSGGAVPWSSSNTPGTCFPAVSALACTWDPELCEQVGGALGREAQAQGVHLLIGPGLNMKRSPLAGRNFECLSEDPLLAGRLMAAYVRGVQRQGVGVALKHFAVNNQEHERSSVNAVVDERTLHEIYLLGFEIAVRESAPWAVMSAANQVNGVAASQHPHLLGEVLRRSWGFDGVVLSDWGAVSDRVAALSAGLNLELPSSLGRGEREIFEAVQVGALPVAKLDERLVELLAVVLCAVDHQKPGTTWNVSQHHELARRAAAESLVLLHNQHFLPLDPKRPLRVALLGQFVKTPRFQGGSSKLRPTQLTDTYSALLALTDGAWQVNYAQGYLADGTTTDALITDATRKAQAADVALVFAGLTDSDEAEGFDRSELGLPSGHERLIEAVAGAQPHVAVVLMNGAPVAMPWVPRVRAVIEAWLGGQAGGEAVADAIVGRLNPSGKLAETFPARLEDTPAFLDYPGREGEARYGERIFIGYRYYERRRLTPTFPFGHGLSYTSFGYSNLLVSPAAAAEADRGVSYTVTITVKNTGSRAGKEVVQLYVGANASKAARPPKELRHFTKLELEPGHSRQVQFELRARDFSFYDPRRRSWVLDPGIFTISVGGSSQGPLLTERLDVVAPPEPLRLTPDSLLRELADHPRLEASYRELLDRLAALASDTGAASDPTRAELEARDQAEAFLSELPLCKLPQMTAGRFSQAELLELLERVRS